MKVLKPLIFLSLIGVVWSASVKLDEYRLDQLMIKGQIPYGPLPNYTRDYYSYDGLDVAFNPKLDLKRAGEFSKTEFESLVIESLDPVAKKNFSKYLTSTLSLSEEYQIDPFWIISVMMVESGFDLKAKSNKNARGLMQIEPDTAGHLYQLMSKKVSDDQITKKLHRPSENIEVGIFYLKKLLQNFRLSYSLATIAYNIGPNKLKELITTDEIDTHNFSYLVKVQDCYRDLTKHFIKELKKRRPAFESTYVIKGQGHRLEDKLVGLYISMPTSSKMDLLTTSENPAIDLSHSLAF